MYVYIYIYIYIHLIHIYIYIYIYYTFTALPLQRPPALDEGLTDRKHNSTHKREYARTMLPLVFVQQLSSCCSD